MIRGAHLFLRQAGYELERVLTGRNEYTAGVGKALPAFNEHLQKKMIPNLSILLPLIRPVRRVWVQPVETVLMSRSNPET
jgi:hypothetical protein